MPTRPSNTLARAARLPRPYICPQCRYGFIHQQQRSVSESHKQKKREAEEQWTAQAREIQAGTRESMLTKLESRGLVNDVVGEREDLDRLLTKKRLGVYTGIDPTAPSMHVGHMVPFMALFWMYIHGFHAVSLIGAGTARIGDPTGRTTDRPVMSSTERKANLVSLHYQLKKLWGNVEKYARRYNYEWEKYWHRELSNNAVWWNKVAFVDVLKYMGGGLRIGSMLAKDTVKRKMESGDGVSFAEFCYPVMQAWDWWHMYDTKGIQMQIGGSDQYGNIVAGADCVKHVIRTHPDPQHRPIDGVTELNTPVALTTPLLTTASGDKFGKSAGNAIWLDQNMTSLADLYAFFMGTADADIERYLKLFTFMPLGKIQQLMANHELERSKRLPQRALASEFVELVHGKENAEKAERQFRERSEQRSFTNLSSLMASETVTPTEEPRAPQQPSIDESAAASPFVEPLEPDMRNPQAHNQSPSTREKATFVSPRLNHYAPTADPNKPAQGAMRVTLPASLIQGQPIARILYSTGLVTSRSEGHRITSLSGAYIGRRSSNKEQMADDLMFVPAKVSDPSQAWEGIIRDHESGKMDKEGEEGVLVLRVGKWRVRVIRVVKDELFEQLNLPDPPGWSEFKSLKMAERAQSAQSGEARESMTMDKSFIEPTHKAHRKDAEQARREGRRAASAYLENEAVRRRISRGWMGQTPTSRGRRSRSNANAASRATEKGKEPSTSSTSLNPSQSKSLPNNSSRNNASLTSRRQEQIRRVKRRMLQEAHQIGSARVLEAQKAERRRAREYESERLTEMREAEIRRQKALASGTAAQSINPPIIARRPRRTDPLQIAEVSEAQRKQRLREKELEAVKERRRIQRERLVGGMVDRGWWKGQAQVSPAAAHNASNAAWESVPRSE